MVLLLSKAAAYTHSCKALPFYDVRGQRFDLFQSRMHPGSSSLPQSPYHLGCHFTGLYDGHMKLA